MNAAAMREEEGVRPPRPGRQRHRGGRPPESQAAPVLPAPTPAAARAWQTGPHGETPARREFRILGDASTARTFRDRVPADVRGDEWTAPPARPTAPRAVPVRRRGLFFWSGLTVCVLALLLAVPVWGLVWSRVAGPPPGADPASRFFDPQTGIWTFPPAPTEAAMATALPPPPAEITAVAAGPMWVNAQQVTVINHGGRAADQGSAPAPLPQIGGSSDAVAAGEQMLAVPTPIPPPPPVPPTPTVAPPGVALPLTPPAPAGNDWSGSIYQRSAGIAAPLTPAP